MPPAPAWSARICSGWPSSCSWRGCSRRWRRSIGFPAVLGELLLGVVLGNLWRMFGFHYFDKVAKDPIIAFLAELGVIVLLLQIGLETRLDDLVQGRRRVHGVAAIGIAAPFSLGAYLVGPLLLPGQNENTYLFLGATLAATSVGITGRVFRDLGRLGMAEAKHRAGRGGHRRRARPGHPGRGFQPGAGRFGQCRPGQQ
jgi:NhaP-type Na+/H+ or K+/H+ antiporter